MPGYRVLGQANPSATTLTDTYTVPVGSQAVVSVINVANRSSVATAFRISLAPAGVADNNQHYIAYDVAIQGNEVFSFTNGYTLNTTDVVRVYATLATLSFTICGEEL